MLGELAGWSRGVVATFTPLTLPGSPVSNTGQSEQEFYVTATSSVATS